MREVERLVRRFLEKSGDTKHTVTEKPAHIVDIERRLQDILGTKVRIEARKNGRRGQIVIEFYSLDEFDRLAEKMGLIDVEHV